MRDRPTSHFGASVTTIIAVIGGITVVAGALTHIPHLVRAAIPLVDAARELHAALTRPNEPRHNVTDQTSHHEHLAD